MIQNLESESILLETGVEWNKILKEKVKKRDNYTCQKCGKTEKESKYKFHVHHINADKFDNRMENLETLCSSCHGKKQWQDCELVDIDLNIFEPVKITKIEKMKISSKKGSSKKTKLWDVVVEGENSFVCSGILIHNSDIEWGSEAHLVPIDLLRKWCKRKLKKEYLALPKQNNIAKKGTPPKKYLRT